MPPPSLFLFGGLFSAAPAAAHYLGNRAAQPLQEQLASLRPPAATHYTGNRTASCFYS